MCMISLFFVNTDHADVLSYEEMNKIYLKGAVSDQFIQFPTKLANSWLRAYILNAPEVCNINRGQTLETKVSLESSNLKILWSSREPHSPVRHLKQKKRNAFFARLCPISHSFQFFHLSPRAFVWPLVRSCPSQNYRLVWSLNQGIELSFWFSIRYWHLLETLALNQWNTKIELYKRDLLTI